MWRFVAVVIFFAVVLIAATGSCSCPRPVDQKLDEAGEMRKESKRIDGKDRGAYGNLSLT